MITLNQDATELTGNKLFGSVAQDANVTYQGNVTVTCVPAAGMEEVLAFTQESHEPAPTVSVGSAEGLASLTQSVQSGRDYSGMTITLTDDIDLSESALEEIGAFKGTIDGGEEGHTISGLDLNYFSAVSSLVAAASLEESAAPTLKNVTLEFTQFTGIDNWKTAYAYATHQDGVTSNASFVNSENLKLENATIALVGDGLRYELRYGMPTDEGNKLEEVAYIGLEAGDPETGEGYSETITNQHIIVNLEDPEVRTSFEDVKFEGNTYIWIQSATTFTMTGCYADVAPSRVGNNSRAAFITSTSEIGTSGGSGISFNLTNNTILSAQSNGSGSGDGDYYSAAIFSWAFTGESNFIGNRFGSEEATERYTFVCIKLMNFEANATVDFTENTIYGNGCNGFDLMQNNSRANTYSAYFTNNTVSGANCHFLWVEADGESEQTPAHGQVYMAAGIEEGGEYHGNNLNGDKLNGQSFDPDTFRYPYSYDFVGWNVEWNAEERVVSGTFAFDSGWSKEKMVEEGLAAEDNTIEIYNGTNSLTTNCDGQIVLDSAADLVALNKYLAEAQSFLLLYFFIVQIK